MNTNSDETSAILTDNPVRIFSVGVLQLATKLGLGIATGKEAESESVRQRELLAVAWLLDSRNSIATLQAAAEQGREFLASATLDEYEFTLPVQFLTLVKQEVERTERGVEEVTQRMELRLKNEKRAAGV